MPRKKRGLVDTQDVKEKTGNTHSYERFFSLEETENVLANPDCLAERENDSPSSPQQIMGEAVSRLAGRQKEVYLLVMREDKSLAETADILNIAKGSVQVYLDRAIRFISGYCKQAIETGRV